MLVESSKHLFEKTITNTSLLNWLPLLEQLRTWFADDLPRVAPTIPLHILYEELHWSSAWPRVRPTSAPGGASHAQ